ncbi:unnamed protein product [Trichobilharzia regenti]|nr:unnamed protein product [Trichobilharzia regenti]
MFKSLCNVDIYGKCGSKECPRQSEESCFKLLREKYKFYLSFENSLCKYYVTEKFYRNGFNCTSPLASVFCCCTFHLHPPQFILFQLLFTRSPPCHPCTDVPLAAFPFWVPREQWPDARAMSPNGLLSECQSISTLSRLFVGRLVLLLFVPMVSCWRFFPARPSDLQYRAKTVVNKGLQQAVGNILCDSPAKFLIRIEELTDLTFVLKIRILLLMLSDDTVLITE